MEITKRYQATELETVITEQGRLRQWVAEQSGVHPSLITHLLARRRTVSQEVAERIAQALGVPLFLIFKLPEGSETLTVTQEDAA
jgi:plasmid maintenance system antidote protein VapI